MKENLKFVAKLFPKLRISFGETPTLDQVINKGFQVRVNSEILQKLSSLHENDYLVVYPTHGEEKQVVGMNLKIETRPVAEGGVQ